jgi:hypothetical protein
VAAWLYRRDGDVWVANYYSSPWRAG